MSFGQKILEKYGFKEGDGLGKTGSGIKEAIKPNFKFDNAGLGDKGPVREDHWWERVFNEASCNVNVQKSDCGKISMDLVDEEGVEITNKSYSMKKLQKSNNTLQYGSFLKSATLLANVGKEEDIEGHVSTNDIEIKPMTVLSDEDLLKACGGRTAHKGARHGLNLTGKLQRIAEQERLLLEKMKGKLNKHEVFREPYAKKAKKNPLSELNSSREEESDETLPVDTESDYVLKASKKRKKQDKKQELQLVTKIEGIGLDEPMTGTSSELEHPTEHEEDGETPYNGTPVRKKKKSKKALDQLSSIPEASQDPSSDDQVKRKKKKGKRKLEDDDAMQEPRKQVINEEPAGKARKVKLDDSYEASESDGDVADRINADHEALRLVKKAKKSTKSKMREKHRLKKASKSIAATL